MAKYVSQTLSYCASESNKFTSSNARQSKRLNGERENMIEKKMSAPVLSDVKKVLFMRPRNCTTESNKL